jgi:hypothetical protein
MKLTDFLTLRMGVQYNVHLKIRQSIWVLVPILSVSAQKKEPAYIWKRDMLISES